MPTRIAGCVGRVGALRALMFGSVLCALVLISAPAHAAPLHMSSPAGKQVDWAHPFPAHLPSPEEARSGLGTARAEGALPTTHSSPAANFPNICYRGSAYNVIVQGKTIWTATSGQVEAWVQYQWCPTYAGDSVGINWAYGRAYVQGCATVYVGDLTSPFENPIGPQLVTASGGVWDDDEYLTAYWVCNGYAWDYTTTAIGSGLYKVWMFAESDGAVLAVAHSPCYC